MQYKNLGKSGLVVSRVFLGCMSFGDPTKGRHSWILSRSIIRHVVESGINFFDTASMSGAGTSEDVLGRAIKAMRRCVRHLQSPQLRNPSTAITLPTGTATAVGANPNFGLISATRLPVGDLGSSRQLQIGGKIIF